MKQIIVTAFGDVENLHLHNAPDPRPKEDEVVVQLVSVGMNQADLMARRGEYRLSSGEPPFTPGIEGGGVITRVRAAVEKPTDRTACPSQFECTSKKRRAKGHVPFALCSPCLRYNTGAGWH